MICKCRNCGGSIEWKYGDREGACLVCGVKQEIEKSDIYEEAGRLSEENTEESLEQAMLLYHDDMGLVMMAAVGLMVLGLILAVSLNDVKKQKNGKNE